jgi:hypothetical protein
LAELIGHLVLHCTNWNLEGSLPLWRAIKRNFYISTLESKASLYWTLCIDELNVLQIFVLPKSKGADGNQAKEEQLFHFYFKDRTLIERIPGDLSLKENETHLYSFNLSFDSSNR